MKPKNLFRHMRQSWFFAILYRSPPEREWETVEDQDGRDANNDRMKAKFDDDTEAILRGDDRRLDPRCSNDLGAKR